MAVYQVLSLLCHLLGQEGTLVLGGPTLASCFVQLWHQVSHCWTEWEQDFAELGDVALPARPECQGSITLKPISFQGGELLFNCLNSCALTFF